MNIFIAILSGVILGIIIGLFLRRSLKKAAKTSTQKTAGQAGFISESVEEKQKNLEKARAYLKGKCLRKPIARFWKLA